MPNWWYRLPRGIRIGIAVIIVWQLVNFTLALMAAISHPYP